MRKIKVGVIGVNRGSSMINYCRSAGNAQVVAICDKWEEGLRKKQQEINDASISYYVDYEDFLKHDMDVVVLANFANEHAPFAVRAMNEGKNVISEVLPCQNMKEAVELIETVKRTGKQYFYAENYCFMPSPREMKRLYREGKIGELEYAEGEYIHNCEPIWHEITQGDPTHWRNNMYANFYCTHSIGPMLHITGLRPVKVTGFELPFNARMARMGGKSGSCGIEMITLENGAVIKSIHGNLSLNSIWYTLYGSKGRMESSRESVSGSDGIEKLYVEAYETDTGYDRLDKNEYNPADELSERAKNFGHGGSDFYTMYNCMEKLLGNEEADVIDVYEALDMFLPGLYAYKSVLAGGAPMDIPDMRDASQREKVKNDTSCTDPKAAGDMLLPSYSKGNPEIEPEIYKLHHEKWLQNKYRAAYWKK